ncbi:MAG: hypothetical protein KJZ53_06410, partial [Anaerolineales bacterium]|nr:hypothetical protein [Anaerolineales bacterium]
QSSGMGRSMPSSSDGIITTQTLTVHGNEWTIYAVGGTPAQVVQHAILEIMPPFTPDLVVAGVNYGTNFGTGVTISGTVGAALEGASYNVPALAVSLETEHKYHLTHSTEIDFKPAAYFTAYFAQKLLTRQFPEDMQVLKIEVPARASIHTEWEMTRLSRMRFYAATAPQRKSWNEPGSTGYAEPTDTSIFAPGTDVHATLIEGKVAVTPISLDMTAHVDFAALEKSLREE